MDGIKTETFKTDHKKLKGLIIIVLSLVILIILGFIASSIYKNKTNPVIFSIDGTSYRYNEIHPQTVFPVQTLKISQDQAYKTLFNEYKTIVASEKAGYVPSTQEIYTQKAILGYTYIKDDNAPLFNNWALINAKYNAINNILNKDTAGVNQGYTFIFWFGNHMQEALNGNNSNINPALASADKAYALSQANIYLSKLKANQISPSDAIKAIQADPRLTFTNGDNYSVNYKNTPNIPWTSQVIYPEVINTIKNQKTIGYSGILQGHTSVSISPPNPPDIQNTFVYFVKTELAGNVPGSFKSKFNNSLNSLKSKYYGSTKQ
jgi:hypothetical protein